MNRHSAANGAVPFIVMLDANAIRLKACRRRGGLDQTELSRLVGTSHSTVSRYERGQALPDTLTLITYELIFDIPASKLLPDASLSIRRRTLAQARYLLNRCQRDPDRHFRAKVEFIEQLCSRLDGSSP